MKSKYLGKPPHALNIYNEKVIRLHYNMKEKQLTVILKNIGDDTIENEDTRINETAFE